MIIEGISGPSDFTMDPRRHMIMENTISLPQDLRPTGVLPDQRTANLLISSFFTNVRFHSSYQGYITYSYRPQGSLRFSTGKPS
jgi:hypothetical protein